MSYLLPGLSLAFFAAVGVLPSGLGGGEVLWQPLPLLAAIFYWGSREDDPIGPGGVFLAGLSVDVLGGGGLIGLWALLALATYMCAMAQRAMAAHSLLRHWPAFGGAMIVVNGLHFAIASVFGHGLLAWPAFVIAALVGMVVYPAVALLLTGLGAIGRTRPVGRGI